MSRTRYFLVPPTSAPGALVTLEGPEFHHGVRVSRLRVGDEVCLIDGAGGRYEARVERLEPARALVRVLSVSRGEETLPVDLAVGLVRAPRFEIAVEKCAELGVRALLPLVSERCVWRGDEAEGALKLDRLRRKLVASCKQAGQARLPEIVSPAGIEGIARRIPSYGRVFLADPAGVEGGETYPAGGAVLGVVGPEGGFTERERAALVDAGAVLLSLGPSRLRTETAAVCLLYRLLTGARAARAGRSGGPPGA